MRLTKLKAVELTEEPWRYLEETGASNKKHWPGWKEHGDVLNLCFLCEYAYRRAKILGRDCYCGYCPLYDKWGGFKECDELDAPFSMWLNAPTKEQRQAAAKVIADLCCNERERLTRRRHELET